MGVFESTMMTTYLPSVTKEDIKDSPMLAGTFIATSTSSTVVIMLENSVRADMVEHNTSLNTYVESMSDEELETALMKYDLLEKDNNNKYIIK